MREAANKMQTTNENLFARNFYNRLRHAAQVEHQISDSVKTVAREALGRKKDEVSAGQMKAFESHAAQQDTNTKDIESLKNDMLGYLRRVPNEKYEAVTQDMEETKIIAELGDLSGFLRTALGLKSVGRAKQWGDQLDEWASSIQSECNSKGGEGEMDPDLMQLMVAMVRSAVAQDDLREQTQSLEKQKAAENYASEAAKLGATQGQLSGVVKELGEKTKFDDYKPLLAKVAELMKEGSETLSKPKTDEEVTSLQGTIIELLVPPDKKGGKQSQAQMQQMMQKMMAQMTKARTGGGNNAKAASGLGGIAAEGPAGKDKRNARIVDKSGGAANAGELPEEFRDVLQQYFTAIEEGAR